MKYLPIALSALVAGLIVFFVQETRIKSLKNDLAGQKDSAPSAPQKIKPRVTSSSTSEKSSRLVPSDQNRTGSSLQTENKGGTDNESMADIMQSEAMRTMIKQGIEAGIPMMYGDFIDSLELSEEETQYFKELLTKRMLDQQQLGMKWFNASTEEREAIALEIEEVREESSAKIDEFLQSKEDSEIFKKYELRLPEHQQMQGIRSALSNEPLNQETEERLLETLYQARINSGEGSGNDDENWQHLGETGDFSVIEERWKATDAEIASSVPDILTPTQTEAFLKQWKTARAAQTMQYKMGMQMLGLNKK